MVKDLVLYLYVMVKVFSKSMGQLGVETPFLKNCRVVCTLGVRHNVVVVYFMTY